MAALVTATALTAVEVRRRRYQGSLARTAVFSACWAATNPLWVQKIAYPDAVLGDIEIRSWIAGTIAALAGIIALWRLHSAEAGKSGRGFAWFGTLVGALISIGGVVVLVLFARGMSAF